MTTARTSGVHRESRQSEIELDRRYGRIAISALVAALPYSSEGKTAASASAEGREDRRDA